jgi:hypothetical protein
VYLHTPSGYVQYEYPTTMTAIELGLSGSMCNPCGQGYGDQYNGGYSSGQNSPPGGQMMMYLPSSSFRQDYSPTPRFSNDMFNSNQGQYSRRNSSSRYPGSYMNQGSRNGGGQTYGFGGY